MDCLLIYRREDVEKNRAYIALYEEECKKRGLGFSLILYEETDRDLSLRKDSGFFVINRSRSAALAASLEERGIPVFNNSEVSRVGNDKLLAIRRAETWGLPVMRTEESSEAFGGSFPLVMKTADGHGGSEVFLIRSAAEAEGIAAAHPGRSFLFQEFCDTPGRDLRIYIVGNRICAAMLRTSDTDFRSNYSLGGNAVPHSLTPEEQAIIETILSELTIGHAGIDLIYHQGNPVFNELEDVVGSRMLYRHTNIDIVHIYMDHICRCI
ncbi:MAG: ATP-grasp domain-containing protein [Lachnospiraceae bacterium]|nr:ATP-grasp domain-containing protein [Lachnospiraceae bacterium]